MLKTGDELLCTDGNDYYVAGRTYTVGKFVSGRYFELLTGYNDDRWYVTMDDEGIRVCFSSIKNDYCDALFTKVDNSNYA